MTRLFPIKRQVDEWWVFELSFKEADGKTVVDITDAQAIRFAIAEAEGDAAFLEATLGNGVEIIDGATGRADVTIEVGDHSSIEVGTYFYTCVVTLESGEVQGQLKGPFTVEAGVA